MSRKFLLYASLVIVLICMLGFSTEVQQAKAQVTFYIRADGSIDPVTAPIYSPDNVTYSLTGNIFNPICVERDNITIDGSGYILQGAGTAWGMNLTDRYNVTIINTRIEGFRMGIGMRDSSKIAISRNTIQNTIEYGIFLYRSSECRVIDNELINDLQGLGAFLMSSYNIISGNLIKDNAQQGMYLNARGNLYYGNNFVNNTVHVHYTTIYSVDFWDNGVEGNYWDNYTGIDLNNNGIGESSHVIDGNHQDYYPLMGTFSGFQATSEHRVETVSNSTLSDFQFNSTALGFYVAGADATAGFVRVRIPTALMSATYRVFVNGTEILYTTLPISNATYSYLYFTYAHSSQEVIIVPEFPSLIILPLFMILALLLAVAYRSKHKARPVLQSS